MNQGTILIVDDTLATLKMLSEILTSEGYQVHPADSGELALASVDASLPELILLDIRMPGMDGFEVLRQLKARERSRNIPVILLTAFGETEHRVQGFKLGAVDFISKPFQRDELLARIHTHLELFHLRVKLELQAAELRQAYEQLQIATSAERKQADEALRASEARYKRITEGLTDYQYTVFVENGRVVEIRQTPACVTVTGYTMEDLVADPSLWIQMVAPDDRERVMEHTQLILAGKDVPPIEYKIIRKDGKVCWVSNTSVLFRNAAGNLLSYDGVVKDITERKTAEEQIRNLAFYDALTQLPNRRLLKDRLEQAMSASKRSGLYGALMFFDLDNFKPLNDEHGHGVGDLLLKKVACRITSCVREMDTVARFGGDEFVVLLSELNQDKAKSISQASVVAEKIRATLDKPHTLEIREEGKGDITVEHHCTSSIGVVLFVNHEASAEDIVKWADIAMYQAKERGGNQVHFFDGKSCPNK